MSARTVVKQYEWKQILGLCLADLCAKQGIRLEGEGQVNYRFALDTQGDVCVRVEVTRPQAS